MLTRDWVQLIMSKGFFSFILPLKVPCYDAHHTHSYSCLHRNSSHHRPPTLLAQNHLLESLDALKNSNERAILKPCDTYIQPTRCDLNSVPNETNVLYVTSALHQRYSNKNTIIKKNRIHTFRIQHHAASLVKSAHSLAWVGSGTYVV